MFIMPTKKILIFIVINLFAGICFGQKVTWGLENKSKTAKYTPKVIGEDEFYFYCASLAKKKYLIERYDKKIMKRRYRKNPLNFIIDNLLGPKFILGLKESQDGPKAEGRNYLVWLSQPIHNK